MPLVRRATTVLLRSPLRRVLDGTVLLITVTGRRTGHPYTLPVQYAVGDGVVWLLPGHPERKTWWRNLEQPAPVDLDLAGRLVHGKGEALRGTTEPELVAQGLRAYLRRFPSLGPRWRVGPEGPAPDLVASTVIVRVVPDLPL